MLKAFLIISLSSILQSAFSQSEEIFFSYEINKVQYHNKQKKDQQKIKLQTVKTAQDSFNLYTVTFENISPDTINIRNVVPFGTGNEHVYITGKGEHPLSRTHLFIPLLKIIP